MADRRRIDPVAEKQAELDRELASALSALGRGDSSTNTMPDPDLQPLHLAPDEAPDGRMVLANGRTVIIEVTGETGSSQWREIVHMTDHLLSEETIRDEPPAAGVFVAPEIDLDMAGFLLIHAMGSELLDRPPARFVPLTQVQVGRLVQDGRSIDALCEQLLTLVDNAAKVPLIDNAFDLLVNIDAAIDAYLA